MDNKAEQTTALVSETVSIIDKAAKRGSYTQTPAARRKSRLMKRAHVKAAS